jgi:cell division protein FtsB
LNRIGNTYWLNNRALNHNAGAQALPRIPLRDVSREFFPEAVGSLRLIPSWIFLAMILVAAVGICATVMMRSRTELAASSVEYARMTTEIDSMRRANTALQLQARRMATDPSMIETAARERLGMVRPNDIVVPIEAIGSVSTLGTLPFVR